MKFYLNVLFPVLLGLLISCSAGKHQFTSSAPRGGYHFNSEIVASELPATGKTNNRSNLEEPVFASSEPNLLIPAAKPALQSSVVAAKSAPATQPLLKVYTSGDEASKTAHETAAVAALAPGPGRTHKLAIVALAAGVLSFAPFVLSMSLLFAIPFAITGIICGRIAMADLKRNRMRKGMALAKAGFLMSSVVAVILVLLGTLALLG